MTVRPLVIDPQLTRKQRLHKDKLLIRRLRHGSAGVFIYPRKPLAPRSSQRYDGLGVRMYGKAGVLMTTKTRRLVAAVSVASILLPANLLVLGAWLAYTGEIGWAGVINVTYFTGTAIALIATLLILSPTAGPGGLPTVQWMATCPVCEHSLRPGGRYCPACGSRV